MQTVYDGEDLRVADLAGDSFAIAANHFKNCRIRGPAVLAMTNCRLSRNQMGGPPDWIMWEVPPEREHVVGAVMVNDCTFEGCTFEGVGFAVRPDEAQAVRADAEARGHEEGDGVGGTPMRVAFHRIIQDSQEYGSNDEHMVSRVFFRLYRDGNDLGEFYTDVKQTVGSTFEDPGSIEVGAPVGYNGPFNQEKFSEAVSQYFRSAIGRSGSAIGIQGGTNIRMHDNLIEQTGEITFPVEERGAW